MTGHLYKLGHHESLRRCVLPHEQGKILEEAHVGIVGEHYRGRDTACKVLRGGIWWPTLHNDATDYAQSCDLYQRIEKPSR